MLVNQALVLIINIPALFYHNLATKLTLALVVIFQQSHMLGKIPDMWRQALTKLIFKKGSKDKAKKNSPISLTCIASKIMEDIIRDSMLNHISTKMFLAQQRNDFRAKDSTVITLLSSCQQVECWFED